jgi:hypothetical protein
LKPNFFVPTPGMFAFRAAAKAAIAAQRIRAQDLKTLAGFAQWRADWIQPDERHGHRPAKLGSQAEPRLGRPKTKAPAAKLPAATDQPARPGNGNEAGAQPLPDAGHPVTDPSEYKLGRTPTNKDVVDFALEVLRENRKAKVKDILKAWKAQHPDHPIFSSDHPDRALRAALSRRRKEPVAAPAT